MTPDETTAVRDALAELPDETSHGEPPPLKNVYLPQSHLKALHPDVAVVTGMRGAGKTFWWSALQDPDVRELIGKRRARSGLSANTDLRIGFGVRAQDEYPDKDVLCQLLANGNDARMVWRSVQAWQLSKNGDPVRQQPDWASRLSYVRDHPEQVGRLFAALRCEARSRGRSPAHWSTDAIGPERRRLADNVSADPRRAPNSLGHAFPIGGIRVKLFLRTDQFNAGEIGNFPDASKLLSSAIDLSWPRRDLYGLLWHLLGNVSSSAKKMRSLLYPGDWPRGRQRVPDELVFDDARQRETLHEIAGPWMGPRSPARIPLYVDTKSPQRHKGNVSPRSFVAALREAAVSTRDQRPDHDHALHYDSIKRGVQKASQIRVYELSEDYPWIDLLLRDLEHMVVPCGFAEVADRWSRRSKPSPPARALAAAGGETAAARHRRRCGGTCAEIWRR